MSRQKLLKHGGLYVVIATHPKMPNHSRNSRGRSQHLAVSAKEGTFTLCNMMVSFGQQSWESLRKPCAVCMAKVLQETKDPTPSPAEQKRLTSHPEHSYSFTINTDASHTDRGNIASWACWIKSSHYLIKEAGVFVEEVPNSSVAELMAFEQALLLLDQLISSQDFLRHHRDNGKILLYINTDSMWTVHALKGMVKRSKHLVVARRIRSLTEDYIIIPRHVKGHTKGQDPRSWVNNWCDKQARKLLKERIAELNGRPKEKI